MEVGAQGVVGVGVQVIAFPRCQTHFGVQGTAVLSSVVLALGQFSLSLLHLLPLDGRRTLGYCCAQTLFALGCSHEIDRLFVNSGPSHGRAVISLGYILSCSIVSPALAERAGSNNLGQVCVAQLGVPIRFKLSKIARWQVVSLGAVCMGVGRVIGPILLGGLFELSPDLPYFVAGILATVAGEAGSPTS